MSQESEQPSFWDRALGTRRQKQMIAVVGGLLLLFIVAMSRSINRPADRLWLAAPGWSRARLIGETRLSGPAPSALDDQGRLWLLLLPPGDPAGATLLLLDDQAEVVSSAGLAPGWNRPELVQLTSDGQALWLSWVEDRQLWAAAIDGGDFGQPHPLLEEVRVTSYQAVAEEGRLTLAASGSRSNRGVWLVRFDGRQASSSLVDVDGSSPAMARDGGGGAALAWQSSSPGRSGFQLQAATLSPGDTMPAAATTAIELDFGTSDVALGPWVGVIDEQLALLFLREFRSGMQANRRQAYHLTYSVGDPQISEPPSLLMVPRTMLAMDAMQEQGRLALSGSALATQSPRTMTTAKGLPADEVAVAVTHQLPGRRGAQITQVGVVYLDAAGNASYQQLSQTRKASLAPALLSGNGSLAAAWQLHAARGNFYLYASSTSTGWRDALSGVTLDDLARMVTDVVFGMLQGMALAPFAILIWMAGPMLALALTAPLRRWSGEIRGAAWLISVVLAVAAFWIAKLTTLQEMLNYVPFSRWIPIIPGWMGWPLMLLAPAAIALLGFIAARRVARRTENQSAVLAVVIYGLVDSVASMAVYGTLLWDRF